jgi:hypothetical protein
MPTEFQVFERASAVRREAPVRTADARDRFAEITRERPDPHRAQAERAFAAGKLHLAHTHPAHDLAERAQVLHDLAQALGPAALDTPADDDPPVPGGVGYGFFYNQGFQTAFDLGTALTWDIICPDAPGGNVTDWLYVTAMNRAALGVEAFVSYHGQDEPRFKIFDWARDPHWQTDMPWSAMGDYLRRREAHGQTYQTLRVWNGTFQVTPGRWRNEVWLANRQSDDYDVIYAYEYAATRDAQNSIDAPPFVGSWGPIVETFQPYYSGTNDLGALATQLQNMGDDGNWSLPALLSPADSYVREDNVGFRPRFIDPNHAFAVYS